MATTADQLREEVRRRYAEAAAVATEGALRATAAAAPAAST